jgi:pimeloyl-ACP methyl ester carboxylesterase
MLRAAQMTRAGSESSAVIAPRMFEMTSLDSCVLRDTKRLAGAALLALALAPTGAAQSKVPRFERGECLLNGDWARAVRRECGWLVVPESRDRPDTKTIRLAVEIFRASEPNGAPPLVLLHGGPGGPGGIRLYSAGVAMTPWPKHRDVVIYDQRGAGLSEPALCPAYDRVAESVYNLRDGAEKEARLLAARRACIAELDAKHIDRLAYNTRASGADLIDLRHELGYAEWDIRGVSYGARLAQEVMVRDPQGIRAVELASPVARGFPSRAEQPLSTQRAFERLFAACALQPSCHDAFPNVEQDFYASYDELTQSPVPVPVTSLDGRTNTVWVDGNHLVAYIRDHMLSRLEISRVPLLLHELRSGDRSKGTREIAGEGSVSPILTGRVVRELITCYDSYGPDYRKSVGLVNGRVRPSFRRGNDRTCEAWLPRFGDPSTQTPVRSDIPTLILTGYFDDRTPTEQARRIAATLSRVYLVELPNEGHDARPGPCHAAIVSQFFEDPTRRPDTSCIAAIAPIRFLTTWEQPKVP